MEKSIIRRIFFVTAVGLLLTGWQCHRKHHPVQNTPAADQTATPVGDQPEKPPVLVIERTPCYGECPTYKIAFHKTGRAVLDVRRFEGMPPGRYMTEAPPDAVAEWSQRSAEVIEQMAQLEEGPVAVDFPGLRITLKGKMHHYMLQHTPPVVQAFLEELDQWLQSLPWEPQPPETPLPPDEH